MNTTQTTKHALWASVTAIALCMVMLVGTTFAWFTDTASTAVNKIQAGNLDVEVKYSKDFSTWKKVDETTKLFEDSTVWEPGRTEIVYLQVKNAGTLALKYTMGLYNLYESKGKNVAGQPYYLRNYVKLGAVEATGAYTDRAEAIAAVSANAKLIDSLRNTNITGANLKASDAPKTYALVLYMPTEVGNEANPKNSDPYWAAKLSFGIRVDAIQAVSESDSYGNTYDEKASTVLSPISSSSEQLEITENMQANGRYGAVQAEKTAQFTINADVYAVYNKDTHGLGGAAAVWASGNSKVVINGGDFRQVSVPADDPICDLIYADGNATIEINGGTFKAVTPERTLNCKDGTAAQITVKGGSFYKYNPAEHTLGDGEVVVAAGYKVVQDGDWYKVVAE